MSLVITGVIYLIVWGFDYKHDYDACTWLWFGLGLVLITTGLIFMAIEAMRKEAKNVNRKTSA